MSKALLIVLLFAMYSLHAWPQAGSYLRVKGRILDKDNHQPLADATVALLNAKDSSRAASGYTDRNGYFVLEAAKPGAYNLYITYLGYQQQLKAVTIFADTLTQLRDILLEKKGVTLGMVEIVEMRTPMMMKKDTLEFNANYYKPRENAVMEELLKRLPGVEVTADGTIKFNGQIIKSILVEGQPFFGDDPKLAARNLPADMIDRIQLIDKRSDQAQFSGSDDGKNNKTINITIKDETKNKLSGRVYAGSGSDGRFATNVSLNRFGKDQLSFIGSGNNINGYQDNEMQIGGDGISRNWNGGANYSTSLTDGLKFSGSYYFNNLASDNVHTTARQNLLADTTYYYNQDIHSVNVNYTHTADVRIEYKQDSMFSAVFTANLNYNRNNDFQENIYASFNEQKQLVNNGNILNTNAATSPNFDGNIFLGKRFKKAGRTLSINYNRTYNNSDQQPLNRSHNWFIQTNGEVFADTVDQRSQISTHGRISVVNLTYTEPIYKGHFLDMVYNYNRYRSSSDKLTYDYNALKGTYDTRNDSMSNEFDNIFLTQRGSISFRTQKEKYDYSIGALAQLSNLNNNDLSENSILKKQVIAVFPVAYFNYAFTTNKRLRFQYNGSIDQPDISLLQPVPNNNNPLYIQLGNPDLKPTVIHYFTFLYNSFNTKSIQTVSLNIYATIIKNKIITASWMDTLGRQINRPINENGAYAMGIDLTGGFPFGNKKPAINTYTRIRYSRDVNFNGGRRGYVKNLNINESIGFTYRHEQLFDFTVRAGVDYNGAWYSQQKDADINLYKYNVSCIGNLQLPFGFEIGVNIAYQYNAGMVAGYRQHIALINGYISKSILRQKRALLKIQGFDLLDQNQGFVRTIGPNYVEDISVRVLQRFFLLSCTYFLKS